MQSIGYQPHHLKQPRGTAKIAQASMGTMRSYLSDMAVGSLGGRFPTAPSRARFFFFLDADVQGRQARAIVIDELP